MTLEEVKAYLHIDADITSDDAALTGLMTAAQEYLVTATGKAYTDSDLMKMYCLLYVKKVYEANESAALQNAMRSILSAIKLGTEYEEAAST